MTMSTAVTKPTSSAAPSCERDPEVPVAAAPRAPDLAVLEDRVPRWLQAPRVLALWTTVIGMLYLILSYQPLWHTDLWGHLCYGRWIWEHGRLPDTEPLMPLAEGVAFVDSVWLTQLFGYGLYRRFGVAAMQMFYAATIAAAFALLLAGVLHRTHRSLAAGFLALVTFAVVDYQQLLIVRPQLVGLVCFVGLFMLLSAARWRTAYWFVVPSMFAVWANSHGSFIVGLGLLAVCCVGRGIDVYRRLRSMKAVAADHGVRRLFVLTELAAVAVLFNPYGLGLYAHVFAVAGHPNLQDLVEWDPLTLRMSQGQAAAVCALALMFAYRFSPRRVRAGEVLLLVGLGGAALWSSRMILWWAPVAAYYLALHTAAILRRGRTSRPAPSPRSGKWSVVTAGLAWIFFAYTPFGVTLLHGRPADPAEESRQFVNSTSDHTPHAVTDYLRRHPPQGLIFNTFEWGDYLLWAGPPDVKVFVASHAHLIPEEVWEDYLRILYTRGDWEKALDRYGVNAVAIEKEDRESLVRGLKARTDVWRVGYEDQRSVVFVRCEAI
jgi:hypothetical protein